MSVPKNRLSLKDWQAPARRRACAGLPRGSIAAKTTPRTMEKITEPLTKEPHYNRRPLIADQASSCFDDLRYSQSAGGVFATFAKDGSQLFLSDVTSRRAGVVR